MRQKRGVDKPYRVAKTSSDSKSKLTIDATRRARLVAMRDWKARHVKVVQN